MQTRDILTHVLVGCLIFCFLALAYVWYEVKGDGGQCLQNPLIYGVKILEKQNQNMVTCSCTAPNRGGGLLVTAENMTLFGAKYVEGETPQFNFSDLQLKFVRNSS